MKKIILIFSIVILSTVATFAQAWHVNVQWDASSSNCVCDASIGSKLIVNLQIVDVANNWTMTPQSVFVSTSDIAHTFYVPEVQAHCADTSTTNIPNYTIYAYVGFWCADTAPPELICNGTSAKSGVKCSDFNAALVYANQVILQ